ncbi:MAG: AarF/UbiB family protein [Bdellovibrio sp.]
MGWIQRGRRIQRTLKNMGRARRIVRILVKYGFGELGERVGFGSALWKPWNSNSSSQWTTAQRLRSSFEELGPTFIKIGQALAHRPDLIPQEWCDEFLKLQDQAKSLAYDEVEKILKSEWNLQQWALVESIEKQALGTASMAQVHRILLKDSRQLVIKVQRPFLKERLQEDFSALLFLAEIAEKNIPELRFHRPVEVVQELSRSLRLEADFHIEANNLRRFQGFFRDSSLLRLPFVEERLCTEKVLALEAFSGRPWSQLTQLPRERRHQLFGKLLQIFLQMSFQDGFFHGDLHAGNIFLFEPDALRPEIGLIDFGLVGHLNRKTQLAIAQMLLALSEEDYQRLAFEYVELAPVTEHLDLDEFARELQSLLSPFHGMRLKDIPLGQILLKSTSVSARFGLILPRELLLFFKSLMSLEGLGQSHSPDFDLMGAALKFSQKLVRSSEHSQKLQEEMK